MTTLYELKTITDRFLFFTSQDNKKEQQTYETWPERRFAYAVGEFEDQF